MMNGISTELQARGREDCEGSIGRRHAEGRTERLECRQKHFLEGGINSLGSGQVHIGQRAFAWGLRRPLSEGVGEKTGLMNK